ncbi:MAG: cytosine deaminase, partial [Cyanobacteria bacterium P01_F01_bin.33]
MSASWINIPDRDRFWLRHARMPVTLIDAALATTLPDPDPEGLIQVDIELQDGAIAQVLPSDCVEPSPTDVDLGGGQVWPCFVDMHMH